MFESMWVKRTAIEQENARKNMEIRKKKNMLLFSFCTCIVITVIFTFTYPRLGSIQQGGAFFVQKSEIVNRIPSAFFFGILMGGGIFFLSMQSDKHKKVTLVCPACNTIKNHDGIYICSCGGRFEDILTMKWVELEARKE